jgi:DNA-binding SARP family transcriptional activator/tetratricopeptide (TPR) repeat protein
MLRIWLLGVMRLEVDGVEVPSPSSRRARLLLAMLVVDPRPHSREALAASLWPGVLNESARASLRTALSQLRAALGPAAGRFLDATREHVALVASKDVWTDVGELQRLMDENQVEAAFALWTGELLADVRDDWIHERRDELRERFGEALGRAAHEAETAGDLATAVRLTRRRIALDTLAEEPQRELIRRLWRSGDRAAALGAYDRLSERLREQLGTAPSTATRELVAAVRSGAAAAGPGGGPTAATAGTAGADGWGDADALPRTLQSAVTSPSPFVGRAAELAWLLERWSQAEAGVVGVVMGGEPGIGKTRLAAELARAVHRRGAHVLYGRCDEDLAVPYQPFVEALRPLVQAAGVQRLRGELGHLAPELGRLWPELAGLGEPMRGDPESERLALFESVAALVEAVTRRRRTLIVVDDVHWAAAPTLLMWRHLIRSERPLRGLVVCTYRDTELDPGQLLARMLADLQRDDRVERLSIGGLDGAAIAALLKAAIGPAGERAAHLARELEAQTAGNPFFIRELLAHAAASGAGSAGGVAALGPDVPEGLRDVIGQRVAGLSSPARRALRAAAVAGVTFSFLVLERVLGEGAAVLDALDEAVAAGLLTELQRGEYAFAHALVRETIYGQLGAARRMRLHRQLGEALEALDGEPVEALAHHFAQAAPDGHGAKAAAYALAAGRSAAARLGYEEAADHYERGLDALALTASAPDQQRCELLLGLGAAHWGAGDLDAARRAYGEAAELAGELGDASALGRAALGFCGPHRFEVATAVTRPVASLLERALAALGDDDSPLRARLIGRLATYTETDDRRLVLAREALEMARRVADKAMLADVLASTHWLINGPDTVDEALAMARELGHVADEIGDRRLCVMAHRRMVDHLLELGDIEAVERELETLERLAETRERYVMWILTVLRANRAHLEGRLADCEALAHDAVAHGFGGHDESASQKLAVQMFFVRREEGRLGELVDAAERSAAHCPEIADWRCALAYIHARLGRTAEAHHALDALAHADFSDLLRDASWLPNLATLSEVAVILGDVPRARLLYAQLSPYAGRCVVNFALLCQGSAARPLGLLATTLSRYDDAERHFERALAANTRIGSPLWAAHTRHDWARMLVLRDRPGDAARALELVREALAAADQLELQALAGDARRLLVALCSAASRGNRRASARSPGGRRSTPAELR